ncbi:hypothetical protein [Rhizobium sp. CSW-27]|uniref:hypothetical protein n=1 Tax=Rhizobium sp. CSW-27 TaxID=2839985 RepID=UPI001C00CA11|nr:hypothetical protein [Rhizobium sp. CSW-27]MBT9373061.1 hypothetical protein [Rhizobium sp. CSW-27]
MPKFFVAVATLVAASSFACLANAQTAAKAVTEGKPAQTLQRNAKAQNNFGPTAKAGIDYQTTSAVEDAPKPRKITLPLPPTIGAFR